ncbi:unnamed protein product, partial [Phaeothamnion confervicola]
MPTQVVRLKFGLHVSEAEVEALFERLRPGCRGRLAIHELIRLLSPSDYKGHSWFSTRESTDQFGYVRGAPDKIVLQLGEPAPALACRTAAARAGAALSVVEDLIREKVHERVGASGNFEMQSSYRLFLDGRDADVTRAAFCQQLHDKFSVVLTPGEVDALFAKYDEGGTGSLDLKRFVTRLAGGRGTDEAHEWFRGRDTYEFRLPVRAPMKKDPMAAPSWKGAAGDWSLGRFESELRDKIIGKSNQDGGRFAYKSAVTLLRSANPDHLDTSHLTRDGMRFVAFRRFDIVMADGLLDQVFAKHDPERTGRIPVHRLVRALLPPGWDGSHHLVPKTDQQGQATKTLLGKVFSMTGKRREVISLNGAGVDRPQPQSMLERLQAEDQAQRRRAVAATVERSIKGALQAAPDVNGAPGGAKAGG